MWNKIFFESCVDSYVEYNIENDIIAIECFVKKEDFFGTVKLFAFDEADNRLCLGSLTPHDGYFRMSKSYTIQYINSRNFNADKINGFSVLLSSGDEFFTRDYFPKADPAVSRAEQILSGLSGGRDFSAEAREHVDHIHSEIRRFPRCRLTINTDFEWYEISDIKETFSLTSIEHLIFTESFVRAFVRCGKWYFGTGKEDNLFAICIRAGADDPCPMENGKDCAIFFDDTKNNHRYWIVGIGLFSDGQYFYRIE